MTRLEGSCRGYAAYGGDVSWSLSDREIYACVAEDGERHIAFTMPAEDAGFLRGLIARALEEGDDFEEGYGVAFDDMDVMWVSKGSRLIGMDVMDADRLVEWLDEVARGADA